MINRSALVVRPAPPFLDWAARLDDAGSVPNVEGEQTVYLLPEPEDEEVEWEDVLEGFFEEIFENELMAWHTDEAAWPKNRSYAMFRQWFKLEWHSVVEDLGDDAIWDDANEAEDDEDE